MSTIDEHCRASLDQLGKDFREVHEWLDFYCGKKGVDESGKEYDYTGFYSQIRHRERRHHWEGIDECVRLFGEEAREAARLHILDDFRDHPNPEYRGRVPSKDEYPMVFWRVD